jgi:hypothetical protein
MNHGRPLARKKPKISSWPRAIEVRQGALEAWRYESPDGIEIYVATESGSTIELLVPAEMVWDYARRRWPRAVAGSRYGRSKGGRQ